MIDRLTDPEREALTRLRDEMWPRFTLDAVAVHLVRDSLIGLGVLPLPRANRSKWAGRI